MATLTIVQMHEKLDLFVDHVNTPRFDSRQKDDFLNSAVDRIIKDRIDNIKKRKPYSFQSAQRLRDELKEIVKIDPTTAPVGNIISFPADYKHTILLLVTIDGKKVPAAPTTYDELGVIDDDPFQKPTASEPLYVESESGIEVKHDGISFTAYEHFYLRQPAKLSRGNPDDVINSGVGVLVPGNTYHVLIDNTIHDGVTYYVGETFVAANADLAAGQVIDATDIINCDLNENLHEEIIDIASSIIEKTVHDFNRSAVMEDEAEKS